jgi:signal transduction histidine kinase
MRLPLGLTRTDVALPAVLAIAGSAEASLADVDHAVAIVTMLAAGLVLCGRRRWPVMTAVGAFMLLSVQARLGVPEDDLVVPLAIVLTACFSLGRYAGSVRGAAGLVVVNLVVHLSDALELPSAQDVLWVLTLTAGPWLAGRLMLDHVRRGDALAAQAHQLVLEQRQLSERLAADERRRIARELHDVIAHSVSVMVVQAGAGADLLQRDPAATRLALEEIQRAGRSALDETGRLLHLLRDDAGPDVAPQPSAADLPGLAEVFRTAGLDVALEVHGPTDELPAGVDLSIFRIVQEGLTNALKHAPHGRVRVTVRRDPAGVDVDLLSTDGPGAVPAPSGRGLIGMRERVAIFGGAIEAGPTENGHHRLHARLPILPQGEP